MRSSASTPGFHQLRRIDDHKAVLGAKVQSTRVAASCDSQRLNLNGGRAVKANECALLDSVSLGRTDVAPVYGHPRLSALDG